MDGEHTNIEFAAARLQRRRLQLACRLHNLSTPRRQPPTGISSAQAQTAHTACLRPTSRDGLRGPKTGGKPKGVRSGREWILQPSHSLGFLLALQLAHDHACARFPRGGGKNLGAHAVGLGGNVGNLCRGGGGQQRCPLAVEARLEGGGESQSRRVQGQLQLQEPMRR